MLPRFSVRGDGADKSRQSMAESDRRSIIQWENKGPYGGKVQRKFWEAEMNDTGVDYFA